MNKCWLLFIALAIGGCAYVTPTPDTIKLVAVEILEKGVSADAGAAIRNIGSSGQSDNPYAPPSPWDTPNTVGLIFSFPIEQPKPLPDNPLLQSPHGSSYEAEMEKHLTANLDTQLLATPRRHSIRPFLSDRSIASLRALAIEIVKSESIFWPDAAAAALLIEHIRIDEPRTLESRYATLYWASGRCAIALDLLDNSADAGAETGREGICSATLGVYADHPSNPTPEKELSITAQSRTLRLYRADTGASIGTVISGPTILAKARQ